MLRSRYNRIPHPALNTNRERDTYNQDKEFWNDLKVRLQTHAYLIMNINDKNLIFSWHKEKISMNYLLVVAKYCIHIYKIKFTSRL